MSNSPTHQHEERLLHAILEMQRTTLQFLQAAAQRDEKIAETLEQLRTSSQIVKSEHTIKIEIPGLQDHQDRRDYQEVSRLKAHAERLSALGTLTETAPEKKDDSHVEE